MIYVVLDLEYNQAFDFGDGVDVVPEESCPFEIIQIGAVKLNERFEYVDSLNALIKPEIYKRIHPYVEQITGLNLNMFDNKEGFITAYKSFMNFIGDNRVIYCVWGANDIKELYRNIEYYGLGEDLECFNFIDVQAMASAYLNNAQGMCIGLKNAVDRMDIDISTPFHNALYDAEYTAKILQKLRYQKINVRQFSHDNVVKLAKSAPLIDFSKLYRGIEKELGRKLTKKEKMLYRNVYFCGRERRYDRGFKEEKKKNSKAE
jgi:DNA polymerase III epsilon subunit-like protein